MRHCRMAFAAIDFRDDLFVPHVEQRVPFCREFEPLAAEVLHELSSENQTESQRERVRMLDRKRDAQRPAAPPANDLQRIPEPDRLDQFCNDLLHARL